MIEDLPDRVSREGGGVLVFESERAGYKAVQTQSGPTVCTVEIPSGTCVVFPHSESGSWNKTHVRTSEVLPIHFENHEFRGWSPISTNLEYSVGEPTQAELNKDPMKVSAQGIHLFTNRLGAEYWLQHADLDCD